VPDVPGRLGQYRHGGAQVAAAGQVVVTGQGAEHHTVRPDLAPAQLGHGAQVDQPQRPALARVELRDEALAAGQQHIAVGQHGQKFVQVARPDVTERRRFHAVARKDVPSSVSPAVPASGHRVVSPNIVYLRVG